jgi:hypothetical protein
MHTLALDELEHIDIELDPPTPESRRRRSRPWIAALLVVALVLGVVTAVPARIALARAGFRHADRILVTGRSLALQEQRLLGALLSQSDTIDEDRILGAEARLRDELEARHAALRRSLRRDWRLTLDGQTDRFRVAVERTMEAPVGDPAIAADAEARARSLRERWHVPKPTPDAAGLHSIDTELAEMQRYVDRPTGVRLIVGSTDWFTELDLDASVRRDHRGAWPRDVDPPRRVVTTVPGRPLAAAGDLVAWVENGPAPVTHVTNVAEGVDVAVVPLWGDAATFSPDGRSLALGQSRGLVVVELATARVDHVPITSLATTPVWDRSGRFLFFQSSRIGGWDVRRHEAFTPRLPGFPEGSALLAALPA